MASGIASGAWGYSPNQVAGLLGVAELGNKPLTYQNGLTSIPGVFVKDDRYISPISIANNIYDINDNYDISSFGKKGKRGKKGSDINYLKKQLK